MLKLRSAPDRLALRFPPPVKMIRGTVVPDDWALRREYGELVAIGDATDFRTWRAKRWLLNRSGNTLWQKFRERWLGPLNRLTGWKRNRDRFLISIGIGTSYWRKELGTYGDEFGILRDIRVYNITDIGTAISGEIADMDSENVGADDAATPTTLQEVIARRMTLA